MKSKIKDYLYLFLEKIKKLTTILYNILFVNKKNGWVCFILYLLSFFGVLGLNNFYLKRYIRGILSILTFNFFCLGCLEFFSIPKRVDNYNKKGSAKIPTTNRSYKITYIVADCITKQIL